MAGVEPLLGDESTAGPSIVLTASALFFISILFGTRSRLAQSAGAF
jgi:zinc/manganese transport system permease protein